MLKNYHGSCHCGAVRFKADMDLSQMTYRCNCTICTKTRLWAAMVKQEAFRLHSGESELTEYLLNTRKNQHFFCRHCGVRSFGVGNSPDIGKMVGVSMNCLAGASPEELINAPITYVDGRHDNWHSPPPEIRHL